MDDELYYTLSDHLGSTTVVADANGDEVGYVYYDPYGQVLTSTLPAGLTDRLFTGQRLEATGLYDYRARMYDPVTGSFIQPDSFLGGVAGFNRYGYVGGNPANYVDPSGHFAIAPWDLLDIGSFALSARDFYNDPSWANAGWLALDTVSLLPIIPSVAAVRHAGKLDELAETRRIDIYGFRGTGRTAPGFIDTDPLIYAGHVGISFDGGKTIYGFTPHAPGLSNREVLDLLKQHKIFPGKVLDDTAIFHHAQDLADQGYRTQVYVQSISSSSADFRQIQKRVLGEVSNSPLQTKRYTFPPESGFPSGCFNCGTWPSTHGISIPQTTPPGQIRDYVKILKSTGHPWVR